MAQPSWQHPAGKDQPVRFGAIAFAHRADSISIVPTVQGPQHQPPLLLKSSVRKPLVSIDLSSQAHAVQSALRVILYEHVLVKVFIP